MNDMRRPLLNTGAPASKGSAAGGDNARPLPRPAARTSPELLPGLPRTPMTPQQQMDAIRRAQSQAEQRVQLGMQLFKAAEARVAEQRDLLERVKAEYEKLRDTVVTDVSKTLQQYDQWIGGIDENLTKAVRTLDERIERLEDQFGGEQSKLEALAGRMEAMLEQATKLLADVEAGRPAPRGMAAPDVSAVGEAEAPAVVVAELDEDLPSAQPPIEAEVAEIACVETVEPAAEAAAVEEIAAEPAVTGDTIYQQLLRRLRAADGQDEADKAA